MASSNFVLKNIDNPHELEKMYRKDPEEFKKEFLDAWNQKHDSEVLSVWYERLYFKEDVKLESKFTVIKDFLVMGILAILSGLSTRLIMHFVERESIAPANLAFGLLPFIAAYFLYNSTPRKRICHFLSIYNFNNIYKFTST